MKFTLKHQDNETSVYEWIHKTGNEKITLFHEHTSYKNTIHFRGLTFVLKDEALMVPQVNESNEWLKHSCKYGHWQLTEVELDLETIDFCKSLLEEAERSKE